MRLGLARVFGGGPGYWLDPDLAEDIVSTAAAMVLEEKRQRERSSR